MTSRKPKKRRRKRTPKAKKTDASPPLDMQLKQLVRRVNSCKRKIPTGATAAAQAALCAIQEAVHYFGARNEIDDNDNEKLVDNDDRNAGADNDDQDRCEDVKMDETQIIVDADDLDVGGDETGGRAEVLAHLTVIDGKGQLEHGQQFSLYEGRTTIGRLDSNNVTLPQSSLSRNHAEIEAGADKTC